MVTTTTGIATSFIQFSRASLATVTNNVGNIAWAGHNLLTNSESFDASAWTKTNLTVNANNTGAPNGTTTADALFETTTNAAHQALQTQTVIASTIYTVGVFVKANGRTKGGVGFVYTAGSFDGFSIDFDLVAQTATPSINGTGVCTNSGITSLGNGWFYVFGTGSIGNFTSAYAVCKVLNDAGAANYAGDITKGLIFWGAHLYRSDLGGMVYNPAQPAGFGTYYPTTPNNLLGFTEDFSNAAWSKNASTVTSNTIVAPNGLQTADTITATAGTGVIPRVGQLATTVIVNTVYTASIYAKAGTYSIVQIYFNNQAADWVNFSLLGGGTATSNGTCVGAITSLNDGWYRLSVRYTAGAADARPFFMLSGSASATRAQTWNPVGTETVYLWGAQLSDSASIDPYSPVYGAAPTSSAYYAPRLDYSPTTIQPLGMLVEEQRTNLLTYSAQLDDASWSKNGAATVTANTTVAPDGTTSADTVTGASGDPSVGTTDTVSRSPVVSSSTAYTASLYVRGLTGTTVTLLLRDGSTGLTASATATLTSSWQRISCTLTSGAATTGFSLRIGGTNGTVAVWGAQFEAGSFATSYIPTGAATATRSADVASVSTQAFPYSSTAGTIVINASVLSSAPLNTLFSLDAELAANRVYSVVTSNTVNSLVQAGGSTVFNQSLGTIASSTVFRTGTAFALDNVNMATNGASGTDDTTAALPTAATRLMVGASVVNTPMSGHIRQITYLPRRISNTELQTRTTL